ncbi:MULTISPECIES: sugar kinase [Aliivibrio]|uniref:2-dehydro-3-deoxygluconokinase n=1 Tax=Aliivibrio logei TaxID=688 RepID=A0A1B9P3U5_ALILO|nr:MULTISPECIES: sugar kinase [Aliivibrio]MBB1314404.1 sugar kinase [Aliivibrio sp. SR45-2]OCH23177.1 ketodeoxygluconokinase [Aliivibrio logei]
MKSVNIAVIGECMVELQKKESELKQTFGGDTLNTALYLSRLTQEKGINVSYVTALGNDPFSIDMLEKWQAEGINTDLVTQFDDKQPGLYYIETDDIGERSFYYWRSDAAAKYLFDQENTAPILDRLFSFDAIYLSGISIAILTDNGRHVLLSFLEQYKVQGGKILFDNNYRPKLWNQQSEAVSWYLKILALADTALLTFEDEQALYGDEHLEQCIERTSKAGVSELIIKRGSKDCLVVQNNQANYVAPYPVEKDKIIDTTAAGDSFSAGFLAKRFCGGNALEAAYAGHVVAGTVIQYKGAIIPSNAMPDLSL